MKLVAFVFLIVSTLLFIRRDMTVKRTYDSATASVLDHETFNGALWNGCLVSRSVGPSSPRLHNWYLWNTLVFNTFAAGHRHYSKITARCDGVRRDLLSGPLNYEDPRVFPCGDYALLTYVEGDRVDGRIHRHQARVVYRDFRMGPPWRLHRGAGDEQRHKNWVLLNGSDLSDTHWSCFLEPRHVVYRVNMFTGDVREGWSTLSPPRRRGPLEIGNGLRGGTNLLDDGTRLWGYGHVKSILRRTAAARYACERAPPYRILRVDEPKRLGTDEPTEYPTYLERGLLLLGVNDEAVVRVRPEPFA